MNIIITYLKYLLDIDDFQFGSIVRCILEYQTVCVCCHFCLNERIKTEPQQRARPPNAWTLVRSL